MKRDEFPLSQEDRLFLLYRDSGDETCFTELFLLTEPWILRVIASYVRNDAEARDVLQTAWENMLRTKERFDPARGSVRNLLCRIAVNAALQALKKNGRTSLLPENEDGAIMDPPASVVPEQHAHLAEALGRLRERYRVVIDLHYFGGFEVREIALLLRVPEGTVKTWLTRARAQLGRFLATLGPLITAIDVLGVDSIWN